MKIFQKSRREKFAKHDYGKPIACIFCDDQVIEDQGVKKLFTDKWLVIANKYPYLDGNLMLIPRRHVENTDDLTQEEWDDFSKVLKNTKDALGKLFDTTSFNIALNLGENSGASIEHLHWQILPRPKKFNPNVLTVVNDFHFVTMDAKELKEKLENL